MIARRFPPPWTVEELDACFVVRDVNGEVLAYVYCEEAAGKLLSKDEARRIAANASEAASTSACRSAHRVKIKNPKAPAVKREAEEDWSR
jgi:hypothetical protein